MDQFQLNGSSSNVNPLALIVLIGACLVMFLSSRKNGIVALMLTAAIVPLGQRFVVAGLHIHFFRVLLLAGLCRMLARSEMRGLKLNRIDKAFLAWVAVGILCGEIRGGGFEVFGLAYDALVTYFLVRCLTKDIADLTVHIRFLAVIALILAPCMAYEAHTQHNVFAMFGGVPQVDDVRDGRVRCQGPFLQPIMAGCFGASLVPLMAAFWFGGGPRKLWALAGLIASIVITMTAVSSGALITMATGVLGLVLWRWRGKLQFFRRAAAVVIIALACVMKAPVWYLIDRVGGIVGGGGWYRSFLIDQFVGHFSQWALIGTSNTSNWAIDGMVLANDPNNVDITNQYVAQGVRGGLPMLILFVAILVLCFNAAGRVFRSELVSWQNRKLAWTLGVTLAAHCAAFISISYFDQTRTFLYWLFAVLSCAASEHLFPEEGEQSADETVEVELGDPASSQASVSTAVLQASL